MLATSITQCDFTSPRPGNLSQIPNFKFHEPYPQAALGVGLGMSMGTREDEGDDHRGHNHAPGESCGHDHGPAAASADGSAPSGASASAAGGQVRKPGLRRELAMDRTN